MPEPGALTPPPSPPPPPAPNPDPGGDGVKIVGRIGTDPEELKQWAERVVVGGETITDMEIADLGLLIKAVQAHPAVKLAPIKRDESDEAPLADRPTTTGLHIKGGRVCEVGHIATESSNSACIGITLAVASQFMGVVCFNGTKFTGKVRFDSSKFTGKVWFKGARFEQGAHFDGARFANGAHFDGASFMQGALFDGARFAEGAHFDGASFAGRVRFEKARFASIARFDGAKFTGEARFSGARFSGGVRFGGASFAAEARFGGASFAGGARFGGASFAGGARFIGAKFEGGARFGGASFARGARFIGVNFASGARFDRASFAGGARFDGANFAGGARFDSARFAGEARFEKTLFARGARLDGVVFARAASFDCAGFLGPIEGDLRSATLRTAAIHVALRPPANWQTRAKAAMARARRLPSLLFAWISHGWVGWATVRSLGGLHILNRASIVALLLVPVLAAVFVALQQIIVKHSTSPPSGMLASTPPIWYELLVRVVGNHPHLSATLALTFVAAVCVTLGLLIYQVFADDTVKEKTEAEHVRDVDARYPEKTDQRNDGLRRALERLEDQAKVRRGSRAGFVLHHGDLIWMPPRDKIEWFDDETLPNFADLQKLVDEANAKRGQDGRLPIPPAVSPQQRDGFVPGAERARICIEEGAKAEYWLLSHKRVWAAWLSLVLYLAGIGCVLWVLGLQCHKVGQAAGWWGADRHGGASPVVEVAPQNALPSVR